MGTGMFSGSIRLGICDGMCESFAQSGPYIVLRGRPSAKKFSHKDRFIVWDASGGRGRKQSDVLPGFDDVIDADFELQSFKPAEAAFHYPGDTSSSEGDESDFDS